MIKKLKNKSILKSYIYSYLILLIIMMTGWLSVSWLLNRNIDSQNEKINEYVISDIKGGFDEYFLQLKQVVNTIWRKPVIDYDSMLEKSEFSNDDYYNAKDFKELIADQVSFEGYKIDAGVYNYKNDTVLSYIGVGSAKEYFSSEYGNAAGYYDIWIKSLKSDSGFFLYDTENDRRIISYCLDCSKKGIKQSDVIIFASMDSDVFLNKINEIKQNTGWEVVVYNDDKDIILAALEKQDAEKIIENASEDRGNIKTVRSSDGQWNYIISFNGWEYAKQTYVLTIIQMLIIMLGVSAAALYVWHASRKHYMPIKGLVDKVKSYKDEFNPGGNEIEILKIGIDNLWKTNRRLDEQNRRDLEIIKQQLLTRLLLGVFENDDIILFDKYYKYMDDDYFIIAIVEPEKTDIGAEDEYEYTDSDINIIFINILEELINNIYKGTVIGAEGLFYCIINTNDPESVDDLRDIFEQAKKWIRQYFKLEFCAAISNSVYKIEEASKAVNEAEICLTLMKMRKTENTVVFYKELFGLNSNNPDYKNIREKLKNYLSTGNYDSACGLIDEELISLIVNRQSFESIRVRLILELTYVVEMLIPDGGRLSKEWDLIANIMQSKNMKELKENIYKCFQNIIKLTDDKDKKEDITEEICMYINENYSDPDLSVSKLSEVFNYHSVYISRKFKEKRNETILSYITKVRISNAKRMLIELDDTIERIAIRSGYASINTFNRVFKKEEGITPSAYREQHK